MSLPHVRVMLVDDDETIVETLEYNLKRHGYQVFSFNDGTSAMSNLDNAAPSVVILDWMLPDMVGPEICRLIRSRSLDVPILMLTARTAPSDVATGLSSGADDYLVKPFSNIELIARLQALLRRSSRNSQVGRNARIELGALILDDAGKWVTWQGRPVDFSLKEFALLKVLMWHAGKTLSTEALLNQVWGADFAGDVKTVAVQIGGSGKRSSTILSTRHYLRPYIVWVIA